MDSDDFGSDDFGDINDDELIAAATQAEQQAAQPPPPPRQQNQWGGAGVDNLFLPDDFDDSDEELPDAPPPQSSSDKRKPSASQGTLRQATLFGGRVPAGSQGAIVPRQVHAYPLLSTQETPTHHKIDKEAAKTWIYPSNVSHRDYQYTIVHKALFSNLLVALPTGLGKTFIAATVMLNWFRWAPESQIAFLAPTKPLVAQQIDACFSIAGIPRSQTAEMTGAVSADIRREYWETRRVFFLTPQTMQNDISRGICDPKRIICLVLDEAHKATGNYAFANVVSLIRKVNSSLRVLALTATPGATIDKVQAVIDSLGIARVEIRNLESIDIQPYVFKKHIVTEVFELTDDMVMLRDLYCECLAPLLKKLNDAKAYWQTDPKMLTLFGVQMASREWMASNAGRTANQGLKGMVMHTFSFLASLALPLHYLTEHGVRVFYNSLLHMRNEIQESGKGGKPKQGFINDIKFQKVMRHAQALVVDEEFSGHPKLDYMTGAVLKHFSEAADMDEKRETRIMVFTSYRSSAEEIVRVLKKHEPMIKPHIFVGQQDSKTSDGMKQKDQIEIIKKFSQGTYNVIVATSIGEEGLDIGEVDMIVCYDQNKTPIRMLQRMGRTGRKRDGHVLVLLTQGKEEDNYKKAWDDYRFIQNEIESGNKFIYHHDQSPRILPREIVPVVDKQYIEIPFENSQPEPKKKGRVMKGKRDKIIKPFFMPEGVKTGFMKASKLGKDDSAEDSGKEEDVNTEEPAPVLQGLQTGLLTVSEEKELNRRFKTIYGTEEEVQLVAVPTLDAFPDFQRNLTKTRYVKHGRASRNMVRLLRKMDNMDENTIDMLKKNFDPDLLKPLPAPVIQKFQPKTTAFNPVIPTRKGLSERAGNAPKPKAVSKIKRKHNGSSSSIEGLNPIDLISSSDDKDITDEDGEGSLKCNPPALPTKTFITGSSDDELPDIADMIRDFEAKPKPKPVVLKPMKSKTAKAAAGRKRAVADMKDKALKKGKKTKRVDSD